MRRHFIALAMALALGAADHSYSATSGTDLVNLGSAQFTVDPSFTTATYTQSISSLTFNTKPQLGDTLTGLFASEQDWSSYASFGLTMTPSLGNTSLFFTVQFYDSALTLIGTFEATTPLSLTPSVVMLGRLLDGTGDFSSVAGMQFTWNGSEQVNVALSDIVGFPAPTSGFFVARAPGGVQFFTSDDNNVQLAPEDEEWKPVVPPISLNSLPAGGTSWAALSDSNAKTDITPLDHKQVLSKLADLPVTGWSYTSAPSQRHFGPMAQDFHASFQLGNDERRISTIDADGVALAAIQGLIAELKSRQQRSAEQARRLADLESELATLAERLAAADR
jgi:hypothetical protein